MQVRPAVNGCCTYSTFSELLLGLYILINSLLESTRGRGKFSQLRFHGYVGSWQLSFVKLLCILSTTTAFGIKIINCSK